MIFSIHVNNIKCKGCSASIKKSLMNIEGVHSVEVDPEEGEIKLNLIEKGILNLVKERLDKMGYPEGNPSLIQDAKSYISCMIGRLQREDDLDQSKQ